MYQITDIFRIAPPPRGLSSRPTPEQVAGVRKGGLPHPLAVIAADGQSHQYRLLQDHQWFRAAMLAKLLTVPVFVHSQPFPPTLSGDDGLARGLAVEQILRDEPGLTLSELSRRLGTSVSHLSHYRRLLSLPPDVRALLSTGQLTYGHARPLVTLRQAQEQSRLAIEIVRHGLSVRVVEKIVRLMRSRQLTMAEAIRGTKNDQLTAAPVTSPTPSFVATSASEHKPKDPAITTLETQLSSALGSPVEIRHHESGNGELTVRYHDLDILQGVVERILATPARRSDIEDWND